MSTEDNKALLRRAWDEVYGQHRLDIIEELVLDDVVAHEPEGDVRGVEDLKRYIASYLAAFPDMSVTVEDVVAEGDTVVGRYTARGTHEGPTDEYGPPTGKQMVIEGITLYHIKGGKLAELWDYYDTMAVMQQQGLVPAAEPHVPS